MTNDQHDMGFFGVPLPPDPGGKHSHHFVQDESLGAYRSYVRTSATEKEALVLSYLDRCGWHGAINDEGWRDLKLDSPNNYAPVITGLKEKGLVVWRGVRRPTRAGNPAKVWVTARRWVEFHFVTGRLR